MKKNLKLGCIEADTNTSMCILIWWRSFQVGFEGQLNVKLNIVSKLLGLGQQENI